LKLPFPALYLGVGIAFLLLGVACQYALFFGDSTTSNSFFPPSHAEKGGKSKIIERRKSTRGEKKNI
jgi:hypothetical protein